MVKSIFSWYNLGASINLIDLLKSLNLIKTN